mgnify:CR=1 FL=1
MMEAQNGIQENNMNEKFHYDADIIKIEREIHGTDIYCIDFFNRSGFVYYF